MKICKTWVNYHLITNENILCSNLKNNSREILALKQK